MHSSTLCAPDAVPILISLAFACVRCDIVPASWQVVICNAVPTIYKLLLRILQHDLQ